MALCGASGISVPVYNCTAHVMILDRAKSCPQTAIQCQEPPTCLPLFPCPNIIFIYSFPHRYIVLFLLLILMFSQCVSFVCLVCSAGLVGSALADDESVVTYILDWLKGRNLNVSCYEKAFAKCI